MKLLLILFMLFSFPLCAQEVAIEVASEQTEQDAVQEDLFSDELVDELVAAMRKRYAIKDRQTLVLRQNELEKLMRRRSTLPFETRQRLELEWFVIHETLSKPVQP